MREFLVLATCLLLGLLLSVLLSAPAWAHGGQYRGPGDGVPPRQRQPTDPVPPAPPPPSTPPTTEPTTPPGTSHPVGPITPKDPGPITPPGQPGVTPGQRTRSGCSTLGFENWVFWYHNNKADIENLKKALYARVGTTNPLFRVGGNDEFNRSDATHPTTAKIDSVIIPALLRTMQAKGMHQDTRSAAFIALAKMATDVQQVELIMKGLDPKLKNDVIVQESAAVGLGLLRREERARQFGGADLDRVRAFLFGVFESDEYQPRTRGFAALGIGLLGDQPSGSASAPEETTEHLFELLARHDQYTHPDLVKALLMAIGMQPGPSLTAGQKDVLRRCLAKGTLAGSRVRSITQSYAALTLGRIGDARDLLVLQRAMTNSRNKDHNIQRSCAIGLGQLGRLVQGQDRIDVAEALLGSLARLKDVSARNFAIISLSDLVVADVVQGRTDVLEQTKVGDYLKNLAADGKYMQRPFGALALGLIGKAIGEKTTPLYGTFRDEALDILRTGLASRKLDKRGRAAYATALGIARDEHSVKRLVAFVKDKKEDRELRGYAALALGLIGMGTREVLDPIREALKERSSEELRQQTATALGLLKDRKAVPLLLEELSRARSQNVKGQVVLALAKIGDARAVDPMVALLDDENESNLTRALACAGLGVIGDLEWLPSLSRISLDVNYRASTDLLNEILSLI